MKYRYTASVVTKSSAEPVQVSVMAQNEQDAIEQIQNLPEFVKFRSLPVRDTN